MEQKKSQPIALGWGVQGSTNMSYVNMLIIQDFVFVDNEQH